MRPNNIRNENEGGPTWLQEHFTNMPSQEADYEKAFDAIDGLAIIRQNLQHYGGDNEHGFKAGLITALPVHLNKS